MPIDQAANTIVSIMLLGAALWVVVVAVKHFEAKKQERPEGEPNKKDPRDRIENPTDD